MVFSLVFVDDATRFIVHAAFYDSLEKIIVEDAFRKAIQQHGVPEAVYYDNGKQYRTKWMGRTCSKLGIRLLFAKPYSPESKGKVERFNRSVGSFLNEVALEKPKTLDALNIWFRAWLSECHQTKAHTALGEDKSPQEAYREDSQPIRFVDAQILANAFLHCENRKVDKVECIHFMGKQYEVGLLFIGRTVQVVYDPADITVVTIEYEGHPSWEATELVIGERTGKRPSLPKTMQPEPVDTSRLLRGAEKQHEVRADRQLQAISYRSLPKEGAIHV